ncbi:MAG TPA: UPF0158 family protein [Acetobacteraceae bacterium]|jgi:Uncharacterised protein family (UPF0158)|nr:UPF0158 family protein [Acetobacteraceae bacterium]
MEERRAVLVDREELEDAFEFVSVGQRDGCRAWISVATGKITLHSADLGNLGDDEDDEEGEKAEEAGIIAIPDKKELDLGRSLVIRFARELMPDDDDTIAGYFDRRGAYGRFRDFLYRRGMLERWYAFEAQATKEAILAWCRENDVGFVDDPKRNET